MKPMLPITIQMHKAKIMLVIVRLVPKCFFFFSAIFYVFPLFKNLHLGVPPDAIYNIYDFATDLLTLRYPCTSKSVAISTITAHIRHSVTLNS